MKTLKASVTSGWSNEDFKESVRTILGAKGAAFTIACMTDSQHGPMDMLMYYDARPCAFNGLFDFYTREPLKGYYPFLWYGMLYDMEGEVLCENEIPGIYTLCSVDKNGKTLSIITYYTDTKNAREISFSVDFGRNGNYEIYLVDEKHDGTLIDITSDLTFTMKPNTLMLIREI